MDLNEILCRDLYWINPAQDKVQWQALVSKVIKLYAPQKQCIS
jgi:hypothetical protein